jgi:hypothetical protein
MAVKEIAVSAAVSGDEKPTLPRSGRVGSAFFAFETPHNKADYFFIASVLASSLFAMLDLADAEDELTGTIACSYGVPAHIM